MRGVCVRGGLQFILDAAEAAWHSMARATVEQKRIVLGRISDCAGSTGKYHYAYKTAREIAGPVIYVGENAHRSGAGKRIATRAAFMRCVCPGRSPTISSGPPWPAS
jgi:UDP-N-acetylmuramoyl-tripeptide--D-alanyl-D-alanine ligase